MSQGDFAGSADTMSLDDLRQLSPSFRLFAEEVETWNAGSI
ncbi:MAG: hypothetical protein R3C49_13050 [Planctomycetaceae bacterium]